MDQRQRSRGQAQPTAIELRAEWASARVAATNDLSAREIAALKVFSDYRVSLGKMFCFTGPLLEKHKISLALLVDRNLLVKEQFAAGYSLTPNGFRDDHFGSVRGLNRRGVISLPFFPIFTAAFLLSCVE
jgi:hypothetical protein